MGGAAAADAGSRRARTVSTAAANPTPLGDLPSLTPQGATQFSRASNTRTIHHPNVIVGTLGRGRT
jgi:hypothetical protein